MGDKELKALLKDILYDLCDLFPYQKSIKKKIEEYFYDQWGIEKDVRL